MLAHFRTARRHTEYQAEGRGASAVEYGLMVAAIAAVIVGIVFGLGGLVQDTLDKTSTCVPTQNTRC
ncbi:MAG: Flp family type IVb pilin [Actinomycetota bacterium]|nr:Flp family type IVb pilin [Actinomycetota bacterium]